MTSVLIVATSEALRALREGLVAGDFSVLVAGSARRGEELLREGGIDIVVVEYELEGGADAFVKILERLPDPPPFVLLAGTPEGATQSARLGASAFLACPCPVDDLAAVLHRMMPAPRPVHMDDDPTSPIERPRSDE